MTASRALRVLMTVDAVGGVWRYAMELGRALTLLDVDLVLVGLGPRPSTDQNREARAIGTLDWLDQPLDWMANDPAQLSTLPTALRRLSDRHGIDLLHLNLPSQAVEVAADMPAIVVTHSCMPTWWRAVRGTSLPVGWNWRRRLNEDGFRAAAKVVAPSGAHADLTQKTYVCPSRPIVVHNGMNGRLHGEAKLPFVFAAGRWWDEGKNARLLDTAAEGLPWPVRMAGSLRGSDGQTVRLSTAEALGSLDHAALLRLMGSAAIVASPSLYEPFGLAALEGARCGAALALADIPTYRELWQDAALFFDPHDPADARRVLSILIGDEDLRIRMGADALARSRRYTADRQAKDMLDVYRSAIAYAAPVAMAEG